MKWLKIRKAQNTMFPIIYHQGQLKVIFYSSLLLVRNWDLSSLFYNEYWGQKFKLKIRKKLRGFSFPTEIFCLKINLKKLNPANYM